MSEGQQTPPQAKVKAPADEAVWFLYVLTRSGVPFKVFSDEAEGNEFYEQYSMDDRSAVYALTAVDSGMLHMTPPVGTEVVMSQSKRKLKWGPLRMPNDEITMDWNDIA